MQNEAYKLLPSPGESEFSASTYFDLQRPRRVARSAPVASIPATNDTGSIQTHLGKGLSKLCEKKLRSYDSVVQVGDGTPVDVQGVIKVQVQLGKVVCTVPFQVADELLYDCILSVDFMRAFQMSIDSGNDAQRLFDGEVHQFHPYNRDPRWYPAIARRIDCSFRYLANRYCCAAP